MDGQPSLGALIGTTVNQAKRLASAQAALVKAELQQTGEDVAKVSIFGLIAIGAVSTAGLFLLVAAALGAAASGALPARAEAAARAGAQPLFTLPATTSSRKVFRLEISVAVRWYPVAFREPMRMLPDALSAGTVSVASLGWFENSPLTVTGPACTAQATPRK